LKLLLDENLSDRIIPAILDLYPGSEHLKGHGLLQSDDAAIWEFAKKLDFTIVSKDSDFHQRSILYGAPPKFIYLRIGNGPTRHVVEVLRSAFPSISDFERDPASPILVLSSVAL
jgi:predicted nuclease of predicted toxin-antitoxin system